ncbi:MAG: ATP synthase F0 subunit A [Phycisphaerales bacterium]|nr:MAG: ATP synthase F0 subunit A [Phycisphaerales bacterium]
MFKPTLTLAADDPNPLAHVLDVQNVLGPFSMHVLTMFVAATLTVLVMLKVAKSIGTGEESEGPDRYMTKGALGQFFEVIILYLRDKMIRAQLGEKDGDRFAPFLLTMFFFILFCNMLGLIPLLDLQHVVGGIGWGDSHWAIIGGTATGNLAVTAGLATIAFFVIQISGIRQNGFAGWLKHFLGGAPVYLAPIMVPVEIISLIIKPSALALRLCANMVAGHTLLATILLFTGMAIAGVGVWGAPVTLVAMVAGVAIYFLEIFVGLLQAFIFTFLTTVFIAQLVHHHDDHAHDDHGLDGHAPAPAHA